MKDNDKTVNERENDDFKTPTIQKIKKLNLVYSSKPSF